MPTDTAHKQVILNVSTYDSSLVNFDLGIPDSTKKVAIELLQETIYFGLVRCVGVHL